MVISAVILSFAVVGAAVLITLTLRKLIGRDWLARLALGVQQFEGLRPIWWYDRLETDLRRGSAGVESLLLNPVVAVEDFRNEGAVWRGRVRAGAEIWSAESETELRAGDSASVDSVDGLLLRVRDAAPAA